MELKEIEGLSARISFDLPFCLYVPDGTYLVKLEGWIAELEIKRVAQVTIDPRLGIEKQKSTELFRDRYGRFRYSIVMVSVPGRAVIERELKRQVTSGQLKTESGTLQVRLTMDEIISNFGDAAFEEALLLVNRFIEVYRHITDEIQMRQIPPEEIFQADIVWYQEAEPLGGTHQMSFGQGITLEPLSFNDEKLNSLKAWLESGRPVPAVFELFRDARDRLDKGEHRLAVIDARTALEVFVDEVLLGYFTFGGASLEEALKILNVNTKKAESIEEAMQYAEINRKLGHGLKTAIGLDLHNGHPELWHKWLEAKQLREESAHRGKSLEKAEAVKAVNSMGEIIEMIRVSLAQAEWLTVASTADDK